MKKFTFLLVVITLFVANIYFKANDLSIPTNVKTEQSQLGDYQKEIDRAKELKLLQDPTIIQNNIRKIGKLTSLEGQYKYFSQITDKGFLNLTLREMTLDFTYSFGIGMSMEYIKINKIEGKTVYIHIPKNRMQLQYIQMSPDSRIVGDKKMFLVSQFKPSDVEVLIEQSQQNVVNTIGADKEIFNKALENLQDELKKLIISMGYEMVVFEGGVV